MNKRNWLVIGVILGILVFFFKPILFGMVPIPLDGLIGTYYPWLDYKWGYLVGVPVKNISVTDVFSQLYPWRILAVEAIRSGEWPLWNPYSFSGTPLLANWQSAPFYPLNILMLLLGDVWGWTGLIICQPLLSMIFMYFYLRIIRVNVLSALSGSVIFAFSGFMVTYMLYATAGQIFLWLPAQLFLLEKYFHVKKNRYLIFASLLFFMVATGGFFQPALYVGLIVFLYYLFRSINIHLKWRLIVFKGVVLLLGMTTAALQLIPTAEFLNLSIRNNDHNIIEYNYGLIPIKNLITFLIPDYFGNPATNNFYGFMGYQETSGYFGVIAMIIVLSIILKKKKGWHELFFSYTLIVSFLLSIENPISKLIYQLNVPGVATGYASRWLMVTGFSAAVLTAFGLSQTNFKKNTSKTGVLIFGLLVISSISLLYLINFGQFQVSEVSQLKVSLRNSFFPVFLVVLFIIIIGIFQDKKKIIFLISILIVADSLRFAIKFTPFAPIRLTKTETPVIDYLKDNLGYFRMEKEYGQPLMPSNSWIYYRLMSPSGYDPLILKDYASWYRIYNNEKSNDSYREGEIAGGWFTRYLDLNNYQSKVVDLAGVKYLLALKMNQQYLPDKEGELINNNINNDKYEKVFEDGAVVVFENKKVLPRIIIYDQWQVESDPIKAMEIVYKGIDFTKEVVLNRGFGDNAFNIERVERSEIISYKPNRVLIEAEINGDGGVLMLTDTNYPGWRVRVNGEDKEMVTANGIYRAVFLPSGQSEVEFYYWPESLRLGIIISGISFGLLLILLIKDLFYRKSD